jgi:hypothetical protein
LRRRFLYGLLAGNAGISELFRIPVGDCGTGDDDDGNVGDVDDGDDDDDDGNVDDVDDGDDDDGDDDDDDGDDEWRSFNRRLNSNIIMLTVSLLSLSADLLYSSKVKRVNSMVGIFERTCNHYIAKFIVY